MFNSRRKNQGMDQLLSSVGKSARQLSDQIDTWASDGYEAVRGAAKSDAAFWGAISMGIGAAAGGLYALWRKTDQKAWRAARRQIATLSSDVMQSVRSVMPDSLSFANSGKGSTRKRSRNSSQLNGSDGSAVMPLKAGAKRSRSMRSVAATEGNPLRKSSRKRSSSRRKKTA